MRPLILLLSLPGWVLVLAAAGIALAAHADARRQAALTARVAAIAGEPAPSVTDLVAGSAPVTGALPEVTLRAQLAPGLAADIVTRTMATGTHRQRVVVLVPPDARRVPDEVAGLIVVPAETAGRLDRWLERRTTGQGAVGPIVEVPGWLGTPDPGAGLVRDALGRRGIGLRPDAVVVDPFLDGRAAALSRWAVQQSTPTTFFYAIATVLALFGAARTARAQLCRMRPAPAPEAPMPAPAPAAVLPLPVLTAEEEEALTPFQRVRRREALREATVPPGRIPLVTREGQESLPAASTAKTWPPVPAGGSHRRQVRAARWWWARRPDPFDRLAEEAARL